MRVIAVICGTVVLVCGACAMITYALAGMPFGSALGALNVAVGFWFLLRPAPKTVAVVSTASTIEVDAGTPSADQPR